MWLKLLVSMAIIAFCVLLGHLAAGKYRARRAFFSQYALFHGRFLTELEYTRRPLAQFLQEREYSGDFQKTLHAIIEERRTPLDFSYLTEEERRSCAEYFCMLGKGDAISQRTYFSAQTARLEEYKRASEREAAQRGALYRKLALLAGFAIVIIIL